MNQRTKDTNRPTPTQVQALDKQLAELQRHRDDHTAATATLLAERPAVEAKHAATVQELEATRLEFSQHRDAHAPSDYFDDAEGVRHVLRRPSNPGRDAALAQVERVLHAQLDERLEAERLARIACNALGLRIGGHQSRAAYADDQLGQLRTKREAQLATHTASPSALKRIRDNIAAMMQRPEEADVRRVKLTSTYWYSQDFSRVVPDGDPAAASLLGRKGTAISIDVRELARLGIPAAA